MSDMTVLVERFCKLFPDAQQLYPIRSDTDGAIVCTSDKRRYLKFEMNRRGSIQFEIGIRHDPPDAWLVLCPCGNIVDFCGTDLEQAVLVYLADTLLENHHVLYRVDEAVKIARATDWYQQLQSGTLKVLEVLRDD
jgi:hypothetical protein